MTQPKPGPVHTLVKCKTPSCQNGVRWALATYCPSCLASQTEPSAPRSEAPSTEATKSETGI